MSGIKHFRTIEGKMEQALDQIPREYRTEQIRRYYPELEEELTKEWDKKGVPSMEEDPDAMEALRPAYVPLDVRTDKGFAQTLSYLDRFEDTMNPRFTGHPNTKAMEWNVEELLRVGRHTNVTAAGRVFSFSALVMLGTGKGTAGLGYGRGPTVPQAVEMAKANAEKNAMSIQLHRGTSIGRDIYCKYKKSFVKMKCARTGWGTNAGWDMKMVLKAFGIQDVSVKQGGSRNKATRYRAIFLGLRKGVRTKHEVSRILGRKLFNKLNCYYNEHE